MRLLGVRRCRICFCLSFRRCCCSVCRTIVFHLDKEGRLTAVAIVCLHQCVILVAPGFHKPTSTQSQPTSTQSQSTTSLPAHSHSLLPAYQHTVTVYYQPALAPWCVAAFSVACAVLAILIVATRILVIDTMILHAVGKSSPVVGSCGACA